MDITRESLRDAGCGEDLIRRYLALGAPGFSPEAAQRQRSALQMEHRRALLQALHSEQRKLDTLDYLLFLLREGDSFKQGG